VTTYAVPILFTLLVWWAGTALVLYLDGRARGTFRWSMAGASAVLGAALYGLYATRGDTTVGAAYCAFTCSVLVWAWIEMSFLMGYITGPRQSPCPSGSTGWPRAGYALQTIIYHELALVVGGTLVFATTAPGANPVGMWTFTILWVMRQSAKLNIFLGVRNLGEEFLPAHLRYLETYFRRRPMNALFPVAVATATVVAVAVWRAALAPTAGEFDAAALTFAATLLTLGIVEHAFLVLPLPTGTLWGFSVRSRLAPAGDPPAPLLIANDRKTG
jgi:putative photosynthetic complex assembly protein 2